MNTDSSNDRNDGTTLVNFEKQQSLIAFQNMELKHKTGWWGSSPYKSYGSIMHWLYVYGNMDIAQRVEIGEHSLGLHGIKISDVEFDDQLQMPLFSFIEKYSWLNERQETYLHELRNYSHEVKTLQKA